MHHTFLKLITELPNKKSFECGRATRLHVAMNGRAHVILWDLEIKVDTLEGKHVSPVIQLLPRGLNRHVEMHELGSDIDSSFHGDETRAIAELV